MGALWWCCDPGRESDEMDREHTLGHQNVLGMKVTSRQRNKECAGTASTPTRGNVRVVVDVVGQTMVVS